jgi:hypothetical protein
MASVARHADPAGGRDDGDQMVSVSRSRLEDLEARASRGELDVRNIQLLQEQVTKLEGALAASRRAARNWPRPSRTLRAHATAGRASKKRSTRKSPSNWKRRTTPS